MKKYLKITLLIAVLSILILSLSACSTNGTVQNKLLKENQISNIDGNTILLDSGETIILPGNSSEIFSDTDSLREAEQVSETNDVVKEYYDRIVVERETVIEISSPEEYEEVFGNETPDYEETNNSESNIPSNEEIIEDFQKSCSQDRTRIFCDKSDKEIKGILENKSGTFTVVESVNIRTIPLESFDFEAKGIPSFVEDPLTVRIPKNLIGLKSDENQKGNFSFMPLQAMQYAGPSYTEEIFINGFTIGYELEYEKSYSWSYYGQKVADAKVYSYIGYGVGLRIPYKTNLNIYNSIVDSDPGTFRAKVDINTLDLDEQAYRDAGMGNAFLFDGKELVLKIGATTGAKVRILGHTIYESNFGNVIDNSRDFKPPINGERVNLGRLVFEGIDTGIYYGDDDLYIDGDIGVTFNLKGDHIKFDCEGLNTECEAFTVENSKELDFELNPIQFNEEDEFGKYSNFGITLDNPQYKSSLNFGFEFSIGAGVKVPYLGWKSVNTPWIELYNFDIGLPYLDEHAGFSKELSSVKNKAYLKIPIFDNITLLNEPFAFNFTNRCDKLHDVVSEGSELSGFENEFINIYTESGDELGSFIVDDGIVRDIDCYRLHSEPSYHLDLEDYRVFEEFDGRSPNNEIILDLMEEDRIDLDGVGFGNSVKSFVGGIIVDLGFIN